MKKIFSMLVLLLFASAPVYAMKIIVNSTSDRTVPSRSSGKEYYNYNDINYGDGYITTTTRTEINRNRQFIQPNLDDLKLLKSNIRGELIGTTWYYPNLEAAQTTTTNTTTINQPPTVITTTVNNPPFSKIYTREAADYYTKDTILSPDKLIPVGYEK